MESLQDCSAPANGCLGCGPANEKGLRIESFGADSGERVMAEWRSRPHHEAFDGVLNGGITAQLCRSW